MAITTKEPETKKEGTKIITTEKHEKTHVPFAIVEAYKTIRTNLMFVISNSEKKRVIVSSSNIGEGKSTTAVNLAIAFAQLGSKVLLIDADMRRPSIYKKMKLPNTKGLSSLLVGFCGMDEAIATVNPCLDVMPSGPIPPNPSELLGSEKMAEILDELNETYEYIFIDTPPVNVVSDCLVLAPITDGIVFIAQDLITTHDEVQRALSSIELAQAKLLGIVLNGSTKAKRASYRRNRYITGGKYKYHYHYKYYSNYSYDK